MLKIFVLEKDDEYKDKFQMALGLDFEIIFSTDSREAFKDLKVNYYDCILLDIESESQDPFELLTWLNSTQPFTPVVVISSTEKIEFVVKAIKLGAFDYITKPFSEVRIKHVTQLAIEKRSLNNEINYLRREQDVIYDFDNIIAESQVMKDMITTLKKFSKTDSTILMTGETGAGKSFLSGTIHFNSYRRKKPFIKINCANIPENLLESELFGHEKGAFTGANQLRVGRFEQAHGGTLFLDEIGEISLNLQTKLLRVLEEKSFERVGANQTIRSDVRVIVATNRDLEERIKSGDFRQDLYYRINILEVYLPPLRERRQDLKPLADWLLDKICRQLKKRITGFSEPVMNWIQTYDWPGNIRQLANTIERAVIIEDSPVIQPANVSMPHGVSTIATQPARAPSPVAIKEPGESLENKERELIITALEDSLWIQKDAAGLLGISPRTLNYKIKKFNITHARWRKNK